MSEVSEEILDLMIRKLDGTATDDQAEKLTKQLLASAEVRVAWLELCRQATALSEIRIQPEASKRARLPWIVTAGIAVVPALALILTVLLFLPKPDPESSFAAWATDDDRLGVKAVLSPEFSTWSLNDFVRDSEPSVTHEAFWTGTPTNGASLLSTQTLTNP